MKSGTKLYQAGSNFELIEYTFLKVRNGKHITQLPNGVIKEFSKATFDRLCLSKIMILTEMEEELRYKIENIHKEMRKFKVEYNPLDSVMVVYSGSKAKQDKMTTVYQYHADTGRYIGSFRSARQASIDLGSVNSSSHISSACKGRRLTAFGFRWSHEEVEFLPPRKTRPPAHNSTIIEKYKDGVLKETYKSINDACVKNRFTQYRMTKIVKEGTGRYKGFIWKKVLKT